MNACFESRIVTRRVRPTPAAKAAGVRGARRATARAVKPPPNRGSAPYVHGGGQLNVLTLDTSRDTESARNGWISWYWTIVFQNAAGSIRKKGKVATAATPTLIKITRRVSH